MTRKIDDLGHDDNEDAETKIDFSYVTEETMRGKSSSKITDHIIKKVKSFTYRQNKYAVTCNRK